MRLARLARLGLEAVDKFRQSGNLCLLFLIGRLLQQHLLCAQGLEIAVVAAIACQLSALDMQGDARYGIEELAVVANDEQRAFVALEPAFQPDQCIEIEVVGRLIE